VVYLQSIGGVAKRVTFCEIFNDHFLANSLSVCCWKNFKNRSFKIFDKAHLSGSSINSLSSIHTVIG